MLCLWVTDASKGVITCLKCQGLLTRATTSVKSQKQHGVIGILCLPDNVLIGTPTLFGAECVHPSFWSSQDWFRHRLGSIITLFYSAALPVRQHQRHFRAAHGDRTFETGRRRRERRSPHSCGVVLIGRCAVMLLLSSKVKDWEEIALSGSATV